MVAPVSFKLAHHEKLPKNKVVCPSELPYTGANWAYTHTGALHFIYHTTISMI
jgi:hypothetical protein